MTVAHQPLRRTSVPLATRLGPVRAWLTGLGIVLALGAPLVPPGLGLAVLLAVWLSSLRWQATRPAQGPLDVAWGVLLLGSLIGFAVSSNPGAALERLAGVAAATALYLLLRGGLRTAAQLRRAAAVLVAAAGCGALAILALVRGAIPENQISRLLAPLLAPFQHFPGVSGDVLEVNSRFPVHHYGLAYLLLIMAIFLTALAVLGRGYGRRPRATAALAAAGLAVLLAATEARGAMLALAVGLAVVAGLRSRWFWGLLPLGALSLYLLLARGVINRSIEADWLNTRLSIWNRSLSMLGDFPLTGAGLGMPTYAEVFAWTFELPTPYLVVHSHNIFIQAYAEQGLAGLVGLLLLLGLAIGAAHRAARAASSPSRAVAAAALGALVATTLYGLTDQVPTTSYGLVIIAALGGLAVSAARLAPRGAPDGRSTARSQPPAERRGPTVRKLRRAWLIFFPLLTIGLLLAGVAPRWVSGLALNLGAAETARAALQVGLEPDRRAAALARSEAFLLSAVGWNPRNAAAYRVLAQTRMLTHDLPGALAALGAARETNNLNDYERSQLGRLYLQLGFWPEAFDLWRTAGEVGLIQQAADLLASKGDYRGAAAAHAALSELQPDEAEHRSNLAKALLAADGKVSADEALHWFEQAASLNPEARRSLARQIVLEAEPCRINERRGGGRFDCAVFWFGFASRIDPSYDKPEVELGSVYYYRGRYEEAAEHFREATRRAPANSSSWHQLGQAEEAAARLPEALAAYQQAVAVGPRRGGLRASLGRLYLLTGNCPAAEWELAEALRLEPDNAVAAEAWAQLGGCR